MFGKKKKDDKKGDLGNIVFPEFPSLKSSDKKLPPLDVPEFSKFKAKQDKEKKLELPDLKLPSFSSVSKTEEIKKVKEAIKQPSAPKMPTMPVMKAEKFAPPEHMIKKAAPKPALPKMIAEKPRQMPRPAPQPQPVIKAPSISQPSQSVHPRHHRPKPEFHLINPLEYRTSTLTKPAMEKISKKIEKKPAVKHIAKPHPIKVAKPKMIKAIKPKHVKIKKIEKKLPKAKPIHLRPIMLLHPAKIHKAKIRKEKHHKPKQIMRALKHVTVKGPVKPRDRITIKGIGKHVSDLSHELSELRSETIKQKTFKGLGKEVDKEIHSIKSLYDDFNRLQKAFRRLELDFHKSRTSMHSDMIESKTAVKDHYDEKKRILDNELEAARKSVHKELTSYKSSLLKDLQGAKKLLSDKQESLVKSMTKKQDDVIKNMTIKQDNVIKSINSKQEELIKKVNARLGELAANNEALTKDLGKITLIESRFNEKLDVNIYNQLVRKINELEANTADNENKLDSDLRATMQYVKDLGQTFQDYARISEAIRTRLLQHEQLIKQIQYMIKNKPKFDLNQYLEEYSKEQQKPYTNYEEGKEVSQPVQEEIEQESVGEENQEQPY